MPYLRLTRRFLAASLALLPAVARGQGAPAEAPDLPWDQVAAAARGQAVNWNAWAGDERTNDFIAWTAREVEARHGVTLRHVRLRDTSEAVARVVTERAAGRNRDGAVDLVWINGPNFLAMKQQALLLRFADRLPNFALVDTMGKPATVTDFTVPVESLAAPWRMAQIVFINDGARLPNPPRTMAAMGDWARAHPGRLTHPSVRNFLGATFLKQALYELTPDRAVLALPATDAGFAPATETLWRWYDALRPSLWHGGRQFPESGPAQRNLLNDGEIDLMVSFNPAEADSDVAAGLLPDAVRTYVLDGGTIGNCSFVAIPYNASAPEAAMVVANFLLSPEAQARAQDPRGMGNPTVLDLARLLPADRALFDALPHGANTPTAAELGRPLPEPHPSWMTRITADWERRTSGG